jgi:hypothetical protein
VRGSYSVTVSPGGKDFLITGVSDVDSDGVYATYTATRSTNPDSPTTGQDVYLFFLYNVAKGWSLRGLQTGSKTRYGVEVDRIQIG